jgi:hypothetical protein
MIAGWYRSGDGGVVVLPTELARRADEMESGGFRDGAMEGFTGREKCM